MMQKKSGGAILMCAIVQCCWSEGLPNARQLNFGVGSIKKKVLLKPREEVMKEEKAIILALPFDRRLPDAAGILQQHYKLLVQRNPEVKEWMTRAPMVAHLRPANLRDVLVRAKLPEVDRRQGAGRRLQTGFKKCGKARCLCCIYSSNRGDLLRSLPHIKTEVKLNFQANSESNSK